MVLSGFLFLTTLSSHYYKFGLKKNIWLFDSSSFQILDFSVEFIFKYKKKK